MLHPCPGAVSPPSLPRPTTETVSTSRKQSARTNYPTVRPPPPSPQSTPVNPSPGIPRDPQLMIHLQPQQGRVHTLLTTITNDPNPRLPSILRGPCPPAQIPHTMAPLALLPKTPTHTSINPNQGLDSSLVTVPLITSNTTQKGMQPAPFRDPSTARLGRGLQLLRLMTRTIALPQTAVFTTPANPECPVTLMTIQDQCANLNIRG